MGVLLAGCGGPELPGGFAGRHQLETWDSGPNESAPETDKPDPGTEAAKLEAEPKTAASDDTVTFVLTNEGTQEIQFSLAYRIDLKTDKGWAEVPPEEDVAKETEGFGLLNGESWEQKIELRRFEPGTYRFAKEIELPGGKDKREIETEFTVE
ncbi:hypothetical protein CDO73_04900 [Saccharibacillus sp. O23]|nr:hypothetical protein CDO73_04900 [Saccharibacillus sp. O23]